MKLDQKARDFITKAKASGKSKEDTMAFLQSKGYDLGQSRVESQPIPTSLTPEQKEQAILDGEKAVRDSQQYSKGESALQGAFKTATFGLGDNIIAGLSPNLTLEDVKQTQEYMLEANPKSALAGEIGGALLGVGGLAKLGAKAMPKVASSLTMSKAPEGAGFLAKAGNLALNTIKGAGQGGLVGGLYGVGEAEGTLEERFEQGTDEAKYGALFGGLVPPLTATVKGSFSPIAKGVKKLFERTTPKARALLNEAMKETKGSLNIDDLVGSDKAIRHLYNAVDIDENIAKGVREISKKASLNSADDTQRIVRDTLGFDNIKLAKKQAGQGYRDLFEKVKKKPIALTQDYKNNPTLAKALKQAREQDLTGKMVDLKDNTLGVAQKVKEQLDDMILSSKRIDDFGKLRDAPITIELREIKTNFVNKLDSKFPIYAKVRAEYGKAKGMNDLFDSIEELKGNLGGNEARTLLTGKNKKALIDKFGSKKAHKFIDEIDLRATKNDRLKKLWSLSEKKITGKEPLLGDQPFRRETWESPTSIAGSKADKVITGKARELRKVIGENLLGQSELPQINPMVEKLLPHNPFIRPTQSGFIIGTQPFRGE